MGTGQMGWVGYLLLEERESVCGLRPDHLLDE